MDYTLFFEKNDQLAFLLLQRFFVKRNTIVTASSIFDTLPISEYKLSQLLISINSDLATIQCGKDSSISMPEKNILKGHNITTTVMNEIRLLYLKRSVLFALFNYQFLQFKTLSKETFMKQNFISKTKFYASGVELRKILNESDFYHSSNIINDSEYILRLHIFEFFYSAFNGIDSPFPDMNIPINNLIIRIQAQFSFLIKPVQKSKLEIFLKIWILRMINGNFITNQLISADNLSFEVHEKLTSIQSFIKEHFHVNLNDGEMNYLYTFLLTQEYTHGIQQVLTQTDYPLAYKLTDDLINEVKDQGALSDPQRFDPEKLFVSLTAIHLRFITLYIEPTTFISLDQIDFFKQTYPIFHVIINRFIEHIKDQKIMKLNKRESANLYFDYMFAFINAIPKELLFEKVHICVDFSQGTLYNNYIIKTLNGFANANIVIESNISRATDIYLSDFFSTAVKKSQTIWRNPPSPDDWGALGDNIVRLKQAKVRKLIDDISPLSRKEPDHA
ncbi:hypothetical protein [Lentilactobacillus kisonensis]|nr:hypothetical protein [Lentilactobacillus kisonensis]